MENLVIPLGLICGGAIKIHTYIHFKTEAVCL